MKHTLVIGGMLIAAGVIAGCIYVYAPQSIYTKAVPAVATSQASAVTTVASTTVAFSTLTFGTNAKGEATRKNFVVRDATGVNDLSELIYATASSSIPAIDFPSQEAIAVFAGTEPTGGYAIEVTNVVDSASMRTVYVTIGAPGSGCSTTEAKTSPYAVITVPISTLPLTHIDTTETRSCN